MQLRQRAVVILRNAGVNRVLEHHLVMEGGAGLLDLLIGGKHPVEHTAQFGRDVHAQAGHPLVDVEQPCTEALERAAKLDRRCLAFQDIGFEAASELLLHSDVDSLIQRSVTSGAGVDRTHDILCRDGDAGQARRIFGHVRGVVAPPGHDRLVHLDHGRWRALLPRHGLVDRQEHVTRLVDEGGEVRLFEERDDRIAGADAACWELDRAGRALVAGLFV